MISLRVEFLENDSILVQMTSSIDIKNRTNLGVMLKEIGIYLKNKYHYLLDGIYDVEVYQCADFFIFEIEKVGDYSTIDFNITFHPNSHMLLEFEDENYVLGKKYYLEGKYYIDFNLASIYFDCFEFGNVIYKEEVESILKKAVVVF